MSRLQPFLQRKRSEETFPSAVGPQGGLGSCAHRALHPWTLTHTHKYIQRSAHQQGKDTRALIGPQMQGRAHPPGTFTCVTTQGSPSSHPHRTHLARAPTRPGSARQPRGRARGQRAPPHGRPCGPSTAERGARTAQGPAWAGRRVAYASAGSAKAPAVRSQTPGTKARREWRAPRGPPPSDTN